VPKGLLRSTLIKNSKLLKNIAENKEGWADFGPRKITTCCYSRIFQRMVCLNQLV
jgi:hypothetical protein